MDLKLRVTRTRVAVLFAVAAAVVGGVAYAAIPDGNGVYTACMLNKVGTIRIIDPSTQHCSAALETQITFNAKGPKGDPGTNGTNGTNGTDGTDGKDGVSVTSAAEPAGTNCANGGSRFTAADGNVTYACNGSNGADGEDGTDGGSGAPWHIILTRINVPAGGTQSVINQCPTGESLLGGTFVEETGAFTVYTSRKSPTVPNAWEYVLNNINGTGFVSATTHTFCATS